MAVVEQSSLNIYHAHVPGTPTVLDALRAQSWVTSAWQASGYVHIAALYIGGPAGCGKIARVIEEARRNERKNNAG